MESKIISSFFTIFSLALASNLTIGTVANANGNSFFCGTNQNGEPTTIARTPQADVPLIVWKTNQFGPEYSPQQRCQIVSAKFQDFYSRGILKYLTTGRENRLNVICAAQSQDSSCETLYTISDQRADPGTKLKELLQMQMNATGPVIIETNTRIYIDMNQYLRDAVNQGVTIPRNDENLSNTNPSSETDNSSKGNTFLDLFGNPN